MNSKRVRVDLNQEQLDTLRQTVLTDVDLSGEQRRKKAKATLVLPHDGSIIDLFFEGQFVATI